MIFLDSSKCGAVVWGALALADPLLALCAGHGSFMSTFLSNRILRNERRLSDSSSGLLAYNGCLVGCATAVFIAPYDPVASASSVVTALTVTTAGASAATIVTLSLRHTITSMPQWTYAFNLVMLTMLLRVQPFLLEPSAGTTDPTDGAVTIATPQPDLAAAASMSPMDFLMTPLKGLSQIFVVDSAFSGLGIAAALTLYSPMLAGHALVGSTLGALTGLVLYQAPLQEITSGLWSFNSALTSLGIGVFCVHSTQAMVLSAGGAVATAGVFAALQMVFGYAYAPCLTLPFCLTMSAGYALAASGSCKGLYLAGAPHSPERNEPKSKTTSGY